MTSVPGRSGSRVGWQILLLLAAAWLGFVAGTAVGGRFLVPEGSGLAAPAIALGYGLIGLVAALVAAILMAWKAPTGLLRGSALTGSVLSLVVIGLIAVGIVRSQSEHRTRTGMDRPLPPASPLAVEATQADSVAMRHFRRMEIDGQGWRARWVAVGPEAARLTGTMTAAEVEALLAAVAGVEARWAEERPLCPSAEAPAPHVYRWRPAEGGDWRRVAADEACLQAEPALGDLRHRLGRLPLEMVSRGAAEFE